MDTLNVVYPRYYPHVSTKCGADFPPMIPTRNCPYPGLMVEIIHLITRELRMKINPIVFGDSQDLTIDADDTFDLFNYIKNGSADTIAMGVEDTVERKANYSFSLPLYKVQTRFIMRQSDNLYNSMLVMLQTRIFGPNRTSN